MEALLDQGPSPVPPSPCSQRRSPEDRGDASQQPHLGRCGRTLSSCQSTARSASGLSGSSPQRQGSRLRTCRFHSKYPGLKGKIIGGSAGETRSVFPRGTRVHTRTHTRVPTACSDAAHDCCLHPHSSSPSPGIPVCSGRGCGLGSGGHLCCRHWWAAARCSETCSPAGC